MATPPRIYTTLEWKAKVVTTDFKRSSAAGVVVHNTEDDNRPPLTGAPEEKAAFATCLAIQKHHMNKNDWSDTGQHFTISRGGLILEGRTGSAGAARQGQVLRGAHASGVAKYNNTYFGIELEGHYVKEFLVTTQQWDALVELCAWLCKWGGITSKTIIGHMDVKSGHTDCPGTVHAKLPELRTAVDARLAAISTAGGGAGGPAAAGGTAGGGTPPKKPGVIATVGDSSGKKVNVYQVSGESAFFYRAPMSVDADGAPRCYHPDDYPVDHFTGLDNPAHGGKPGNWWAIATHNDKPGGTPLVQKASDPAPGYWISQTALSSGPWNDPRSYVDAATIPYFVMPTGLAGAKKGDFGIILNTQTGKHTGAIFADTNPAVGEGSLAAAAAVGLVADARHGGTGKQIIAYLVFPKSGNGRPRPLADVLAKADDLFEEWGGKDRLEELLKLI